MLWLQGNLMKVLPQTMAITAMTAGGEEITTWNLAGVVPVKWSGPTLDIMSNSVATETLEVAYQEIIGLGRHRRHAGGRPVDDGVRGHRVLEGRPMVMDAVGSAVSAVGQALGLVKNTKAKLACMGPNFPAGDHEIECMFNPTEYRLSQTLNVTHNRATAQVGGTPEFSGTNAMTLSTQLFFDDFASAKGDVTPKITTLLLVDAPDRGLVEQRPAVPAARRLQVGRQPAARLVLRVPEPR